MVLERAAAPDHMRESMEKPVKSAYTAPASKADAAECRPLGTREPCAACTQHCTMQAALRDQIAAGTVLHVVLHVNFFANSPFGRRARNERRSGGTRRCVSTSCRRAGEQRRPDGGAPPYAAHVFRRERPRRPLDLCQSKNSQKTPIR